MQPDSAERLRLLEKVLLFGASGYIGRHVARELSRKGYLPICPLRRELPELKQELDLNDEAIPLCDLSNVYSIRSVFDRHPDLVAVISCIASRTGGIKDSWAVDYLLNKNILTVISERRKLKFILLSAICVQKPRLNFQFAKLAFESLLQESGLEYTIVRPTAFFKSLSGQVERVKNGKRFIVFDNGKASSTKPISERDLSKFIVETIYSPTSRNKVLPIGGPGPNLNQKEMGKIIFDILKIKPKFFYFPSQVFKVISVILYPFCLFSSRISDMREFAKIAHYYATESMLFWDSDSSIYSAEATPETGYDTLRCFYSDILKNGTHEHKVQNGRLFK